MSESPQKNSDSRPSTAFQAFVKHVVREVSACLPPAYPIPPEHLHLKRQQHELETAELRRLVDDPEAMHSHYLRIGNGWEVWRAERVRGLERENESLIENVRGLEPMVDRLERENAALRSLASAMADEMEQHGGEQAFESLARYRAARAKEAKP